MNAAWFVVGLLPMIAVDDGKPISLAFVFGRATAGPGETHVAPGTPYNAESGHGFEPGAKIVTTSDGEAVTADAPFLFSAAVPEGNYVVTVTFAAGADATVKAEARRLMIERVVVDGRPETRTFVVNVRTPAILGGGSVRLKDREKVEATRTWDDKLTLEFNGPRPLISRIAIAPVDVPNVFILGDSTVCDQPREPFASWGQMLPRFFRPTVAVANHAESGESLRSSRNAGRLVKVVNAIRPGDFLLIQYGHNDMKSVDAETFRADLKRLAGDARERGAKVVLITPVQRRTFLGTEIANSHRDFPDATKSLAKEEGYPLIDLHALSKTLYEALGPEGSAALFKEGDGSHHNAYGAYEVANCVVLGLRRIDSPLADALADDLKPFDPAHPDPVAAWSLPASPDVAARAPDGN